MRGSSAESLERLSGVLAERLDGGEDGAALGDDLLRAAGVLRSQVALRRAATDPATASAAKSGLLSGVFGGHLGKAAAELLGEAGGLRWAASTDLPAALEQLGVTAVVKAADSDGDGDRLEDELFGFGRAVADHADLRDALSDPARPVADKQQLVRGLLEGKATAGAIRLAEEAAAGTHLTVNRAIDEYIRLAAAARGRRVATVRVAHPLTDDQQNRLAAALGGDSNQPVHLNIVIDPEVVGGIRVEIGDHVVDGTIASRVDDATRRVAG